MESKSDDDMGFEKVDDGIRCDKVVENMEYVMVEKPGAGKTDADVAHEKQNVDDDMDFVKGDGDGVILPCPFPKRIQDMDLLDVDLSYEEMVDAELAYMQYSTDTDMEHEEDSVDDDVEYGDNVFADVECKQERVDADVECKKEIAINDMNSFILPYPFPKRRRDMHLEEIVKDVVLPFLPAKSLVRFRSVSKEWDWWIKKPFLAHQQSYYFKDFSGYFCQFAVGRPKLVSLDNTAYGVPIDSLSFLPESVNIISSSNGLLLCHGRDALDPYYVCNPATLEWARLPPPHLYHGDVPSAVLAFQPSALNMEGHYHLLCSTPTFGDQVSFELYSSATSSWKVSETTLVEMEDSRIKGNGFYMKGIAYMETSRREVIAFHLATELYEIIPLPYGAPEDGVLTQAQGELCYIGLSHVSMNEYSVMIYTGMELGLGRRLDVKIGPEFMDPVQYRALPCLDGDSVMILVGQTVYCYNLGNQSVEKVTRVGNYGSLSLGYDSLASTKYLAYVNSLVQVAKPSV